VHTNPILFNGGITQHFCIVRAPFFCILTKYFGSLCFFGA
jgi:hypothetical protein